MGRPICFGCKHFRRYPHQPLHFRTPGECTWDVGPAPDWLTDWLGIEDKYYGPRREVSTAHPVLSCAAFEEKPNG